MIECPNCQFQMDVKGARPGRFSPKCSSCGKPFTIIVSAEAGQPIKVMKKEETRKRDPQTPPPRKPPAKPPSASSSPDKTVVRPSPSRGSETLPQQTIAKKLGGYEIIRELGRGAMGSVYLARQVSLDRPVAVKVMNPEWAMDPVFLSRFTREAYAAAHLVHHNVVQIHDIGEERGQHFFSMEFVDGQSLGELVTKEGRCEVRTAVGYVLQAARGLKFAHDRQMIHRDVKPDNLMLNSEGIVKVADLGLVKTPESVKEELKDSVAPSVPTDDRPPSGGIRERTGINITQVDRAMGTPAYMAPEQVRDASSVDQRADIYSLGCTLYAMVTGRTVFEGATAEEIMTKQATEPIEPPEVVARDVPHELSSILMKMLAKDPRQRFQHLGEVINVLQDFLAHAPAGTTQFGVEQVDELVDAVNAYNGASFSRLRTILIGAFFGLACLMGVGLLVMGQVMAGVLALGVGVLTTVWYQLLAGFLSKSILFRRMRQYLLSSRPGDWIKPGLILVIGAALLYVLNLHVVALGAFLLSGLFATGFHFSIDRLLKSERAESIRRLRHFLISLRQGGIEEEALRESICRHSGDNWEPVYEMLFGYEAKMIAQRQWGIDTDGDFRRKHGPWRDRIIAFIDGRAQWRKQERDRKHLMKVERLALQANGVPELKARKKAEQAAQEMMTKAADLKSRQPGYVDAPIEPRQINLTALLLGSRFRVVLGLLLVSLCVLWMHQNDLIPGREIQEIGQQMIDDQELADAEEVGQTLVTTLTMEGKDIKPLELPGVPESVSRWFASYNPGLAGLVLIVSGLFRGVRLTVFLLPAVAVIMFGHAWGIPAVWKVPQEYMSMAIGGALAVVALYFGRS